MQDTAQILEEGIRDINITHIASENNVNKQDLVAVLQSGGFQGPPGDKGERKGGNEGPPGAPGPPSSSPSSSTYAPQFSFPRDRGEERNFPAPT